MTEAPEREVLFMPKEQTEIGWRWAPDDALRWRAPVFNDWEEDFLRSSPLIARGATQTYRTHSRLIGLSLDDVTADAAASSNMTMLHILSHGQVAESKQYNKWADVLSPLSVLRRRMPDNIKESFDQHVRRHANRVEKTQMQLDPDGAIFYRVGELTYAGAPLTMVKYVSALLRTMLRLSGHRSVIAKTEAGYYELEDGQDNQK